MKPLVSVITPNRGRLKLLLETIQNVRAQTYRPIEHIIVTDGIPSVEWQSTVGAAVARYRSLPSSTIPDYSIRIVPLGRHWSAELRNSFGAAPVMVGQLLASGEYQCLMADDERMTPEHVEKLVNLLEAEQVDFVYPFFAYYRNGDERPLVLGTDPPRCGTITHALYRRELLDLAEGPMRTHRGREADWEMYSRWIKFGARWAMLNEVTFSHRDDKEVTDEAQLEQPLPVWATP